MNTSVLSSLVAPSLLAGVYGAFLGAVFASFYGVVAERVPAGKPLGGRSSCVCGRQLKASENMPIIGWLACKGVARCCGARIPSSYLRDEIFGATVGLVLGLVAGFDVVGAYLAVWGIALYVHARRKRAGQTRIGDEDKNSGSEQR